MNNRQVTPAKPAEPKKPPPHGREVAVGGEGRTGQASSLVKRLAGRWGVDADKLLDTLKETAFKSPRGGNEAISVPQLMALLVVSAEYKLNPFLKEIYAFPSERGGIIPIIGIDGWIKIMNSRPELDYQIFRYPEDATELADFYVETEIKRKDRAQPTVVREYYSECVRNTTPWQSHPKRMTRHKSLIQCIRIAFGYGGVYDPDEADAIYTGETIDATATEVRGKPVTAEPQAKQIESDADKIKRLLNEIGETESLVLSHYEAADFASLTPANLADATVWLEERAARPPPGELPLG